MLKTRKEGPKREMMGFVVNEVDIHIKGRYLGNDSEIVYKDRGPVGRVTKIVYSYIQEKRLHHGPKRGVGSRRSCDDAMGMKASSPKSVLGFVSMNENEWETDVCVAVFT